MKIKTFDERLQKELKDSYFKKLYKFEEQKFGIVKNIINFRIKHNLSQADLAKRLKVTQRQISNIEIGEFTSVSTLEKVLLGIGMTVKMEAIKLNPQVKERVSKALSCKDWDDIHATRKEFKTGKSVSWRSIKRG